MSKEQSLSKIVDKAQKIVKYWNGESCFTVSLRGTPDILTDFNIIFLNQSFEHHEKIKIYFIYNQDRFSPLATILLIYSHFSALRITFMDYSSLDRFAISLKCYCPWVYQHLLTILIFASFV